MLASLLEHLTAAIMILDRAGRVIYLSHQQDPLLAHVREMLLGSVLWEALPEAAEMPFFGKYRDAFQASLPLNFEEYLSASSKWFEIHVLPSPDSWAISIQDITHRKREQESLSRAAAVVTFSDDAIFSKSFDGTILSWNNGAKRLYGYAAHEIIGQSVQVLVPLDRQQEMQDNLRLIQAGGYIDHFETVRLRKDGSLVDVSLIISPIRNACGQVTGSATITRDISERRKLQEQIRRNEQNLQAIIDGSPACIYVKDVQGSYTHVNKQVADLSHTTKEQMLGKRDSDFFPQEFAAIFQAHDQEVLETKRAGAWEEEAPHEDGLHTYLSVKFPLFDDHGVPNAVCGISTDITERKLLERRKDDFISMASHELKTPLTTLIAYTELLHRFLDQENNQKVLHYLSRMDAQLTKFARLITDLLDIAKVHAGKLMFVEENLLIDDLVGEVVEHFLPTAPQHRILIEGSAGWVIGDRDRLGQVLLNLLSNAVKYSPQADRVMVRLSQSSGEVTVSIQDFGIGIPSQHREHIFERFYRVPGNSEKLFPGLGIGLFLCQQIIHRHGGRIWVESVEGQGATFSFALPPSVGDNSRR